MRYLELKKKQREVVNNLPIHFAFNNEQFAEIFPLFGLKHCDEDKKKLTRLPGGGFCLKTDLRMILDTFKSLECEMQEALKDDEFCIEALRYEADNHEYNYTEDPTETVEELGLSMDDDRVRRLFYIAVGRNRRSK